MNLRCLSIFKKTILIAFFLKTNSVYSAILPCTTLQMNSILASDAPSITLNCIPTFQSTNNVSKTILIQGPTLNGQTINCNGAHLNNGLSIFSKSTGVTDSDGDLIFIRPENITLKNCNVQHQVRVYGMGGSAGIPIFSDASKRPYVATNVGRYVQKIRDNAPYGIKIDGFHITAKDDGSSSSPDWGKSPIYIGPGVSQFKLTNSTVDGKSKSVAIYLEAESTGNILQNNTFNVSTLYREQIALDGSSNNTIVNNKFISMSHGGISAYRNCGEAGTIRISTPSNNAIINNTFVYQNTNEASNYTAKGILMTWNGPTTSAAVVLGYRDATPEWWRNYNWVYGHCREDDGYPYGSSLSDYDYATANAVRDNQIIIPDYVSGSMSVSKFFFTGRASDENPANNSPNSYVNNTFSTSIVTRPSMCFISNGWGIRYLSNGQSTRQVNINGDPGCDGYTYKCEDGVVTKSANNGSSDPVCQITKIPFDCAIKGNNTTCIKSTTCPTGQFVIGGNGNCNLNSSNTVPTGSNDFLKVLIQASGNGASTATCFIDSLKLSSGGLFSGFIGTNKNSISIGCSGYNSTSSDGGCRITGAIYCHY